MNKFTNFYYSNYSSSVEGECPGYDSDNSDTYKKLMDSPSQTKFRQYLEHRKEEELIFENWKLTIHNNADLVTNIEQQCGLSVCIGENRVCYFYEPDTENTPIPGIRYKITLVYVKLLRKWYISPGRSRIPEIIDLSNNIRNGTYNPIGSRVLKLMSKVKNLLEVYVLKLIHLYRIIDEAKGTYKDIEFELKPSLNNLKIMLKENAWPTDMKKTSSQDIIIIELALDDTLDVENLNYECIYKTSISRKTEKIFINKLEEKLKIFYTLPLIQAFDIFMNPETFIENEF
ncbi:uncharacterized protein LOC143178224 [Calliopsis andreniformis]|uniref:uncharacterized protein LOC143178224 n=1 Tax=Calliopsis andreniformis TaxID=337506 RepID=UPI003FCD944C